MSEGTPEPMRRCVKCGVLKTVREGFYSDKRRKEGWVHRRGSCRECIRAYNVSLMKEVTDFLSAYKLRLGCQDCGWNLHAQALEFDHRPDEVKVADVSDMRRLPLEQVMVEVAKCDVVCANCHRIRTFDRQDYRRNVLSDLRAVHVDPEPDLLSLLDDSA